MISRIMLDLGILETSFARIVLAVAVIEDVILYVLLAIALGLVAEGSETAYGLPGLLDLDPSGGAGVVYHVAATLAFLGISLVAGPQVYRRVLRFRYNVVRRGSAIGFQLVFMFLATAVAVFLGVVPLFGRSSPASSWRPHRPRGRPWRERTSRTSLSRSSSRSTSRWSDCASTSSESSTLCSSRPASRLGAQDLLEALRHLRTRP